MTFVQTPPQLRNQYDDDRVLQSYLRHALPREVLAGMEPGLRELGRLAGDDLYRLQVADRASEPVLTHWDAWGNRIDHVSATPLWQVAERIAAEHGVVAAAYDTPYGHYGRVHQFALAYLFTASTDLFSCPLAMTDGAASALLAARNDALVARALPHLISRDPREFWTSGQWMTEAIGGSDVGQAETVARHDGRVWRLHGRKWFVSAVNSRLALTLARPEGNPPGGKGLALFYIETHDGDRRADGIRIERLKDKLGTRKLPTAELTLDGVRADLVADTHDGVRHITPMLNVTRAWNAVSAAAFMRRGLALARDYARRRVAFGAPLADQPLHVDTLAGLQAEFEGAFHLAMFIAELLGRIEHERASDPQQRVHRALTPIAKLLSGRQVVTVMSEVIEAFGGAGYVEDTGLPALLRDAHVLPIWEGTTNVLALDALRALADEETRLAVRREAALLLNSVRSRDLLALSARVEGVLDQAEAWRQQAIAAGRAALEAGARRYAMTLGRAFELALLLRHAQRVLDEQGDRCSCAAANRFAAAGISLLHAADPTESRALRRGGD